MDSNRICYQVRYLQSNDIVFLVIETEIADSGSQSVGNHPFCATVPQTVIIVEEFVVFFLASPLYDN